jgi:hypothetical protein
MLSGTAEAFGWRVEVSSRGPASRPAAHPVSPITGRRSDTGYHRVSPSPQEDNRAHFDRGPRFPCGCRGRNRPPPLPPWRGVRGAYYRIELALRQLRRDRPARLQGNAVLFTPIRRKADEPSQDRCAKVSQITAQEAAPRQEGLRLDPRSPHAGRQRRAARELLASCVGAARRRVHSATAGPAVSPWRAGSRSGPRRRRRR